MEKFLRTWGEREKRRSQYHNTAAMSSTVDGKNPADVTLTLSKRLIAVVKVRSILHIEAGLEMIALAVAISSEVSFFYIFELSDVFLSH